MITLVTGSLILSVLHALIPNHWLPVIAIGKREGWSKREVLSVTFVSGLSHVLSTLMIGWMLAFFGWQMSGSFKMLTQYFAPGVLVVLGIIFIYRHHVHKHFHIEEQKRITKIKIVAALAVAMFFSPCLEIEAYFLMAGTESWRWVVLLSLIYFAVTLTGMLLWTNFAYKGLQKFNWHALEHETGIVTGATLIITGIISFFIN